MGGLTLSVYEQQSLSTITIDQLSFQDKVIYAEGHLATLGESVLALSKDQDFRTWLHSEMEKQIDGDYNVLFETLYQTTLPNHETSIYAEMNTGLNKLNSERNLVAASHAFEGIENSTFFPQIHIPFYEDLKVKSIISSRSFEKAPIIVISPSDDKNKEEYLGYTLDANNNLVETDFMIDEKYAQENEVWVISINEVMQNCIVPVNSSIEELRCTGGGNNGGGSNPIDPNLTHGKFYKMKVTDHKERWVFGASEIAIKRAVSWKNTSINPNTGYSEFIPIGSSAPRGNRIANFSWRTVKKKRWKTLNWWYWKDWNPEEGNALAYMIFEYDAWPAGIKNGSVGVGNYYHPVTYRSTDYPYHQFDNITDNGTATAHRNFNGLEFISRNR